MSQSLSNDTYGTSSKGSTILIEIAEPQNHGVGAKRYTDYLVKTRVSRKSLLSRFSTFWLYFCIFLLLRERLHCQYLRLKSLACDDATVTLSGSKRKSSNNSKLKRRRCQKKRLIDKFRWWSNSAWSKRLCSMTNSLKRDEKPSTILLISKATLSILQFFF